MSKVQQRSNSLAAWIRRRRNIGQEPNADEIWGRLLHNWPDATPEEQEAIFNGSERL